MRIPLQLKTIVSPWGIIAMSLVMLLSGCFDSGFRLEQTIKEAVAQAEGGNAAGAIDKLEALRDKHPKNADVTEALGIAYEANGDFLKASSYYATASYMTVEKSKLLKDAANAQFKAGRTEEGINFLLEYLKFFPEDGKTWLQLGHRQFDLNAVNSAADSLTRGVLLSNKEDQLPEDFQVLGQIYLDLKDYAQADYYFNMALPLLEDNPTQGQVLVGLVNSSVAQKDWDIADVFLYQIESSHPGLLEVAEVASIKRKINEARANKTALIANEKKSASEKEVTDDKTKKTVVTKGKRPNENDEEAKRRWKLAVQKKLLAEKQKQAMLTNVNPDKQEVSSESDDSFDVKDEQSIINDEEIDSNASAIEMEDLEEPDEAVLPQENNGGVDVEPEENDDNADVDVGLDKPEDGQGVATELDQANEEISNGDSEASAEELPELDPYVPQENEPDLLLIQAHRAMIDGDSPSAIRMAWDSINLRPESPSGWYVLSRAYTKFGQDLNAEAAALEAKRLNPLNKKIVWNYLGILQRSRTADRFHQELIDHYRDFSNDPDFVLAVARSYARIKNDVGNASTLYQKYLDMVPESEKKEAIQQEAALVK